MHKTHETANKPTILVADDALEIRNLISAILDPDYKVIAVNNGAEALKLAQSDTPPNMILLDIMMPEMSGYEVCKQLKADTRTRDIPVIFLSAMAGEGNEAQGRALGAVDFLTKPIDPYNVVIKINGYFALIQKQNELNSLK
jgi:CheY-like chemotaxis protein